jgi:hypothetical protein
MIDVRHCLREIVPQIREVITNNSNLDNKVDAFKNVKMAFPQWVPKTSKDYRRYFGLRIESALENINEITFVCSTAYGYRPPKWYDDEPNKIYLYWGTRNDRIIRGPTDYAILHELCHRAGFNESLLRYYTRKEIEDMASSRPNGVLQDYRQRYW